MEQILHWSPQKEPALPAPGFTGAEDTTTAGYRKKSDHRCNPGSKSESVYFETEACSSLGLWNLAMAIPQLGMEHLPFARTRLSQTKGQKFLP